MLLLSARYVYVVLCCVVLCCVVLGWVGLGWALCCVVLCSGVRVCVLWCVVGVCTKRTCVPFVVCVCVCVCVGCSPPSGPVKTPVGACSTATESVEIGVETILSGKARVVIAGGYDDLTVCVCGV